MLKHSCHRRRGHGPTAALLKISGAVILRSVAFLVLVVVCIAAIRWISDAGHSYARNGDTPSVSFSTLAGPRPDAISSHNRRLVYPYSIIPGGAKSAAELRDAAAHDPVVAEHYAGFDYSRARVIEVSAPRLVYLSYRRKDRIYWTRKQASLPPGEKLLTDGRITARTRCANQVSVLPKAETSPEEPTIAELERPDAVASGTEGFPNPNSTLAEVDPGRPGAPGAASPGTPSGGYAPPGASLPVPIAGPGGGTTPPPSTGGGGGCIGSNCNPPPPPAPVPEPGTLLLVASGTAAVFARYRFRS
jgi:PEP-CTERM motif